MGRLLVGLKHEYAIIIEMIIAIDSPLTLTDVVSCTKVAPLLTPHV